MTLGVSGALPSVCSQGFAERGVSEGRGEEGCTEEHLCSEEPGLAPGFPDTPSLLPASFVGIS